MLNTSLWMWVLFLIIILTLLFIDLGILNRKKHVISLKEALGWTLFWFSLAMLFNIFIGYKFGYDKSILYFTCYIIEEALSVDNLFVILLIFTSFHIAPKNQHKILFWGILGAIILRGIFILAGTALVTKFQWILYIFGLFLIYGGISNFFKKEEKIDPHDKWIIRTLKKIIPISKSKSTDKFFVREKGKLFVTIAFVALIVIEFTDVLFATDSIPAIFGITTEPFIIFTSNIFAILGLRSLYFVILHAHNSFKYLGESISVILIFIGLKMLLAKVIEIHVLVSLGIIIGVLLIGIIASVASTKRERYKELRKRIKEKIDMPPDVIK
jgi:tellurite resistance protein TerC